MHTDTASCLSHPRFRAGPWQSLPQSVRAEAARYVVDGAAMRPFLRAIAAGDLYAASRMGVGIDLRVIADFFRDMPDQCHGNWTKVAEWEMIGGLTGINHLNDSIGALYG